MSAEWRKLLVGCLMAAAALLGGAGAQAFTYYREDPHDAQTRLLQRICVAVSVHADLNAVKCYDQTPLVDPQREKGR